MEARDLVSHQILEEHVLEPHLTVKSAIKRLTVPVVQHQTIVVLMEVVDAQKVCNFLSQVLMIM